MTKDQLQQINSLLDKAKKIFIVSHLNPDGDAIGASLALFHYLEKKGFIVKVSVPNEFPDFLSWMPGAEQVLIYKKHSEEVAKEINETDLIFCLDFNALSRLDKIGELIGNSTAVKIMIDHHPNPVNEFDLMISEVDTSSTSELIFNLINELGDIHFLNKDIATCIYTGIMTDTGSFSFSCNSEKTYEVLMVLFRTKIDGEQIHRHVYDTYSESRMRLLGFCLSEKLKVMKEFCTAYISLSREDLKRFHHQMGDTEGVVNYALSIKGINFAVLFTEKDGLIRLSLRSKGDFSVNDFARLHFNGGGHRNAAGADSNRSLDETLVYFESLLPQYKAMLHCAG